MKKTIIFFVFISVTSLGFCQTKSEQNIPIATQWTLDAAGTVGRSSIPYIYLVICPNIDSKGTGFQLKTGEIITCSHVVRNSKANEIFCRTAYNQIMSFTKVITDTVMDLAILIPDKQLPGGLSLGSEDSLNIGNVISTWGFPLGHNGPSPLLSVGYLSGFNNYQTDTIRKDTLKHLVVNGAFNPGNSGGPLFSANSNKVIGIVVNKSTIMLNDFQLSAIKALSENISGVNFIHTDKDGKTKTMVESQVVASLLNTYKELTQVMIGEAISVSILKKFLKKHKIKY
jgi:hypothetical protein